MGHTLGRLIVLRRLRSLRRLARSAGGKVCLGWLVDGDGNDDEVYPGRQPIAQEKSAGVA